MKKVKLIFTNLVTLILASTGMAQDTGNIDKLLDSERYQSAEAVLEEKISDEGALPNYNYLLVKTYLDQDKVEEAKKFISSHQINGAADADPMNQVAYARFLLQKGDQSQAATILNNLAENKKNRKNPELMMAMAQVYLDEDKGDASKALEWLKYAADKDDDNANIYLLEGAAYKKLRDANNAYLSFSKALKKDKLNVRAHYLLGKMFVAQHNPEVYLGHLTKAYEIDPTYAPVLEELYNHYYYQNLFLAKKYLEEYIAHSDPDIKNDYRYTDILYLNGDYQKAIEGAKSILAREKGKAQPRLYKLMAYSAMKSGDTISALTYARDYFEKEQKEKMIAPDYEMRAMLTATQAGKEKEAATYYAMAAELDSLKENKIKYAGELVSLYKKLDDQHQLAYWYGKLYEWKENSNNVDLFNWGIAHYLATEYAESDSVFAIYTTRYPEDIYGYYWRAQNNAAIDTGMVLGSAVPYYQKVTELGEKTPESSKKMLLKAYGFLGGYEANTRKDYAKSLEWFDKYLALDPANENALRYAEMLRKWLESQPKEENGQ